MKTFVILSDSHGRRGNVKKIEHLFGENDFIVHLGDGSSDLKETFSNYPDKTFIMKGNCDFCYGMEEYVIEAEGVRILCCHGHKYGVKRTLIKLAARARELGCDAALYGHTHTARIEEVEGVLTINPGALSSYSEPSYCYLVVNGSKLTPVIVPIAAS